MAVKSTPQDATTKWVQNLGAATNAITAGVNAVSTAPGAKAAAQSDKWLARITAAKSKWQTNVGSVSLQSWQQSMINVGIPRVSQGAQAKQGKYAAFASQFFPYLNTGIAKVQAMPSTTLEDNIARATAMIRYNAGFKRTASGGGGQ